MNARRMNRTMGTLPTLLLASMALSAGSSATLAGDKAAPAKCAKVLGLLVQKDGKGGWRSLVDGDPVAAGHSVVAFPGAILHSADGKVALDLVADLAQRGPYPVLETSVQLHETPAGIDLSYSLDRGLVILENLQKEGPAKVRFRGCGRTVEIDLLEPGTKVAMELYSRYPPGAPRFDAGKLEEPGREFVFLVLKGRVFLKGEKQAFGMQAPPGQALLQWDSIFDNVHVRRLDALPPAAAPMTPLEKVFYARVGLTARRLRTGDRSATLKELIGDKKWANRLIGVTLAGALEDLPTLIAALEDERHADVRDHAVLVLRHWMGRGPEDLRRLHDALIEKGKYSKAQTHTLLQLLFGFPSRDLARPDTYQLLMAYLDHSKVGVRELARWHLVRLAPAGRKIEYDAAAAPDRREEALRLWRRLLPAGTLPGAASGPVE